ncbi:MAG: circadian clock protein KaiA [Cyanobacteria bacterium J06643_13]
MSNITYKPQIDVYSRKRNILSIKSSERFSSTVDKEKHCQKYFDNISEFEQKKIIKDLKVEYSLILYDYFSDKDSINHKIEDFTREAFKIDLPMSKVVEIHLDLIDNLEKQLMLEGLHVEYLSDFRLTLIDVIAHLGEMYRNKKCVKISR